MNILLTLGDVITVILILILLAIIIFGWGGLVIKEQINKWRKRR